MTRPRHGKRSKKERKRLRREARRAGFADLGAYRAWKQAGQPPRRRFRR